MPYVNPETDLFPANLFDQPDLGDEQDHGWWGMYTLSRQEKKLMRHLQHLEIPFYCPIAPMPRRSPAGRVRTSHLPLFSNYVFVYGGEMERYRAVSTGCVANWMKVADAVQLTQELRQLKLLIATGKYVQPEARLLPGTQVRVSSGPLRNVEGTIIRREGKSRLLLSVKFLEQGASVALEDWEVEPFVRAGLSTLRQ